MSYILDALRRADAERERGAVPGLHAQNIPADPEPAARDYRPLIWAAGGAGALAVAVVVLLIFAPWRGQPAPVASASIAGSPAATTRDDGAPGMAPAAAPAPAPAALPVVPVVPPVARVAANRAPDVQAPIAGARAVLPPPLAARVASQAAEGRVAVLAPKAPPAATATTPAADAQAPAEHYGAPLPTPAPAPANPNAIVPVNDLPPATRATLPKLAVGGAIYSDSPAARMLILNGQIYHEGDKPAADTVLEQIRHKSAVLNFRGQRYEIMF